MSLALENLREYLERAAVAGETKADFARACGVHPSLITNILDKDVGLSGKNVPKIMQGFKSRKDRVAFLAAYLRDETPDEYANDIMIHVGEPGALSLGSVMEMTGEAELDSVLLAAFHALPSEAYRRRVVTLVRALRGDAQLRELFKSTVDYLQPEGIEEAAKSTAADIHAAAKAALAAKDPPQKPSPGKYKQPPTPRLPKPAAPQ